jgi:hypothetical protein
MVKYLNKVNLMRNTFLAFIIFCFGGISTHAQVKFKLTRQEDRKTYIVSMISEETYEGNQNITGTAQVTLRIEGTADFLIREITSLGSATHFG